MTTRPTPVDVAVAYLEAWASGRIYASRLVFDTYEVRRAQGAQAQSA